MPIPTYTLGYPPDGSSLGQTKSTMRNNLDGTFETLGIDHVNNNGQPGSNPAGYHTIVHEVPQASVSTVSGYNQLFCGVPGTLTVNGVTTPSIPSSGDTQFYSLTGGGSLTQLTGYSASQNGYCWSGGVLLQWGLATGVPANGTLSVNFPVSFPSNCFNVQVTGIRSNSGGDGIFVLSSSVGTNSFTLRNGSGSINSAYWLAIGN